MPIKIYSNAVTQKSEILEDAKGKAGIYMWEKLEYGKRYRGSSENLHRRLKSYYYPSSLSRQDYSYISRALLAYGYDKFSLIIL